MGLLLVLRIAKPNYVSLGCFISCHSDAYLQEARERDDLEVLSEPRPMPLGEDGNLPPIAELG